MPFNMGSTQHEVSPVQPEGSLRYSHAPERDTPGSSSSPPQTDVDLSMIPVHVSLEHPNLGLSGPCLGCLGCLSPTAESWR